MEFKDIRLIALDCDGTLLSRQSRLTAYSEDVLRKLREKGILVVICSGRPWYSIEKMFDPSLYDYAVCENGRTVVSGSGKVIEQKRCLNREEIQETVRYVEKYRVMMSCAVGEEFRHYTSKRHHYYVYAMQKLKNIARRILGRRLWSDDMRSDYEKLFTCEISKICFSGMPETLKKLSDSVDRKKYTVLFTSPMWLEIQPYGLSKASGMRRVMEIEQIGRAETAAIGDGENDLSMIEAAGTGVAMKNSMDVLKNAADFVTEYANGDDGCARWISAHILENHSESGSV